MPPTTYSLETSSLVDALYSSMRTRIITGEIAQGERLTEKRIATEYDVARPTAKACLERLIVVGLVRRSAHKTAVVPTLGEADVRDLFFTRELVETAAVAILAEQHPTPASVRRTQDAMEIATRTGVFEDQVAADIDFHSSLVLETGSERLVRMHDLILGEVQMTMGLHSAHKVVSPSSVAAEHAAVIEAIDAGDADLAATRLRDHLDAARERLLARLKAERAE
ncbi:GntR family transcriptional regulator [Rhodococcus pseudokoreensis]|uniref:GntR family transcriptional regulator n=1 Tax=Rhodococcus pseudokoreensis TaxID=2811421 RepID=A0A974W358_9NOCA|nr:GntR family transcriptional regulator [Rhodococcus pseudokoreensis]QSE89810.1 GntR family transcriptional regulator [Rhodococcus pseudokoreensis]